MKIEIDFPKPEIQVSFQYMENGGIILYVYYFGGERFQHYSDITIK